MQNPAKIDVFFHDNRDYCDNIDFVEGRRHLSIAQAWLCIRFALPLMLANCRP